MRNSIPCSLLLVIFFFFNSCAEEEIPNDVKSPDGKLKMTLKLNGNSELFYRVEEFENEGWNIVIEDSPLGIIRTDTEFKSGLEIERATPNNRINDKYTMLIGGKKEFESVANQRTFGIKNPEGKQLDIILRVYNDGVAFKYVFPGNDPAVYEVSGELTGFKIPTEGKAWLQAYDTIDLWAPAYEQFFFDAIDIGTPAPANKNGWCFPLLFKTGDYWIFVSEAGLRSSYCASHIDEKAPDGLYSVRFPEENEANNYFPKNPTGKLPWSMPWRFMVISKNKESIFNSDHVHHLSDPPAAHDHNWVKPGVASWSWWSESDSPRDFKALKGFIDFAAEMEWEYCLIDEGWHEMKGGNLEKLVEYAKEKKIGILLWYESGARTDYSKGDKQRQIMFDNDLREREFERISRLGVKGVKVDFFQSDKQGVIKLYHDILVDAAQNRLLVNFHGCTLPRGWSKTYPHLLTMESIRGAEAYKFFAGYPEYAAKHNTIIPFTRNVCGPMDYTPITLSDAEYPHQTSTAHELALGVIFQSGIQHFADHWVNYKKLPDLAIEYLKELAVSWDRSMLISGYPGKDVIIARKKGKDWYIAGINGENVSKEVELDLSFLPPGSFDFILLQDGSSRDDLQTSRRAITRDEKLKINMIENGGFVAKTGSIRPLD